MKKKPILAEVILPLRLPKNYTYIVPPILEKDIQVGLPVIVHFGKKKIFTAIVYAISEDSPSYPIERMKEILAISTTMEAIYPIQLNFWKWISEYYLCTIGEVMHFAFSSSLIPRGDMHICLSNAFLTKERKFDILKEETDLIDTLKKAITLSYIKAEKVLGKKKIYAKVQSLINRQILEIVPRLKEVSFSEENNVRSSCSHHEFFQRNAFSLSASEKKTYQEIMAHFSQKSIVLWHSITGEENKISLYIHLVLSILQKGEQALILFSEIALISEAIDSLEEFLKKKISIYHSLLSNKKKVAIWKNVYRGNYTLIVGTRSAIFLPFKKLGLVIIDKEHDSSHKQFHPAPRYHARDSAIFLGQLHKAKILLESINPSIESYFLSKSSRYSLVSSLGLYKGNPIPERILIDTRKEREKQKMKGAFSFYMHSAMKEVFSRKGQVILFQNRRGYSSYILCEKCDKTSYCPYCNVHLVYHFHLDKLLCRYCCYAQNMIEKCPYCHSGELKLMGLGTEKIENEFKQMFSGIRIRRIDSDSVHTKRNLQRVFKDFKEKKIDVLIGTQMLLNKGLNFRSIDLVGIFEADKLLYSPDFRIHEHTFQLINQISSIIRKRGRMIIQANYPHSFFGFILSDDYISFYEKAIRDRKQYRYPPFTRLIRLFMKSKNLSLLDRVSEKLAENLHEKIGIEKVLGPQYLAIEKIRSYYLKQILIKLERNSSKLKQDKKDIFETIHHISDKRECKGVQINIDVDTV